MKGAPHMAAGVVATFCIALFWLSSVAVEIFGGVDDVARVKSLIVSPGLFVLIPAMMATGAGGFFLARGRGGRLLAAKKKRMPFIAANGLLILLPCAIFLAQWSAAGQLDARFYAVQAVELAAGAVNFYLMFLNFRDGLKLSGRRR